MLHLQKCAVDRNLKHAPPYTVISELEKVTYYSMYKAATIFL